MKIGLYAARTPGPDLVRTAQACEHHGVDSLWHDESLWYRGTISMLSACAVNTQKLRLGVASVNPFALHPTYFAMQYATLAELSGGRAVAAMGSGVESWLAQMGIPHRLPRTSVKEGIEITRSLLSGRETDYHGKAFTIDGVTLSAANDFRSPLLWGAMGERSIESCGEVADGWVVSAMEPTAYVERGLETIRAGAAVSGRDLSGFEVVQYQVFACDADSEVARSQAKDLIALLFRTEFDFCVGQESLMTALSADLDGISMEDYANVMRRLSDGVPPAVAVPDELVAQTAIAGTPAECAAQLQRFAEIGVTEVGLLPAVFDVDETPRIIGEEIKPLMSEVHQSVLERSGGQ